MSFNQRATVLLQLPVSPLTWDGILNECDRLHADFLHIPSEFKWALDYKRFQVERDRGNNDLALAHLKAAIAATPYNTDILSDYQELVKKTAGLEKIALIISSKRTENQALRLADQFDQADIDYVIVSGADAPSIGHFRALQVDASDKYEARPQKVAAAFAWIYENIGGNVGVMKIDDDMLLLDAAQFKRSLAQFSGEALYTGVPSVTLSHDRCQHWGLCQDRELNRRVYGRPVLAPWAIGGAYYLGPKAVEKLVLSTLRFPGLFEGEYYEDKLVGDILVFESVSLTAVPGFNGFGLGMPGLASPPPAAHSAAAPVAMPPSVPAPAAKPSTLAVKSASPAPATTVADQPAAVSARPKKRLDLTGLGSPLKVSPASDGSGK